MARYHGEVTPDDVFVFWTYDLFPYTLGSKADMTRRKGSKYYVPSYQHWVQPFAVVDGVAGAKLIEDLENMRDAKREEERALNKRYAQDLLRRLKQEDITHPNKHIQGAK